MERRTIISIVVLTLGLLVYMWIHNNSVEEEATKENTSASSRPLSDGTDGAEEVLVPLVTPEGSEELFFPVISTRGATLQSVVLNSEQYAQSDRQEESPAYVPVDRVDAGSYDVVGPWDAEYYPGQLVFRQFKYGEDNAPVVERIVRRSVSLSAVTEAPNWYELNTALEGDLRIQAGDQLAGSGSTTTIELTAVDGNRIHLVSSPPADWLGGAAEVSLQIVRKGTPAEQFVSDDTFTEVTTSIPGMRRFIWPNPERDTSKVWIQRDWWVQDSYLLGHRTKLLNMGSSNLDIHYALQITGWVDPHKEPPGMFSPPTADWSPACYVNDALENESFTDMVEDEDGPLEPFKGNVHWWGVNSQYFLLAAILPDEAGVDGTCRIQATGTGVLTASFEQNHRDILSGIEDPCMPEWYPESRMRGSDIRCVAAMEELGVEPGQLDAPSIDLALQRYTLANGNEEHAERGRRLRKMLLGYGATTGAGVMELSVYAGPKDLEILSATNVTLETSLDFWWFGFLAKPMLLVMKWLNERVHNWAIAIVLLTVLIKLLMLPLTQKSYVQMQKMQLLKPEMETLQKKYKNDKAKLQQETMNMYKRQGVNPLGGCLPMVFQMPVYIALYRCIYSAVDLYQAPLFGWIADMTQPDPYFILPVLLGGFMFLQQMFMPSSPGADPMQQKIMKIAMPIMFSVFMLMLPAGLVFYIFVSTAIGIGQQWAIRRKFAKP